MHYYIEYRQGDNNNPQTADTDTHTIPHIHKFSPVFTLETRQTHHQVHDQGTFQSKLN